MPDELKTIDGAITNCENKRDYHIDEARKMLRNMIYSLGIFAYLITAFYIFRYLENSRNKNYEISENIKEIKKIEGSIRQSRNEIKKLLSNTDSATGTNFQRIIDTDEQNKTSLDSLIASTPTTSNKVENSNVDNAPQYILYGILILTVGIFSSLYRYHQKEISRFESFSFGLHRIRIAANNGNTGFEDEVRTSLVQDAFHYETKTSILDSNKKKVESPVPGYPSSDIATAILNKFLDSIEIVTKPKDK